MSDPASAGAGPAPVDRPSAVVERGAIEAAADRIGDHVRRTPVVRLEAGAVGLSLPLWLKLDLLQPTGSFKVRGAFSLLQARQVPPAGVIAASGGNFGLAIAYAAHALGHAATVFVPGTTPSVKIDRIRELGATVEVVAGYYPEAFEASQDRAAETGALVAHAYDQPEIVAGAGTCAAELDADVAGLDTVLVAVGGGGLIAGTVGWYEGRARVVGVESEGTPTLFEARRAGHPVDVAVGGIAASALGARRIGSIAWAAVTRWTVESVLVGDDDLRAAQRRLWDAARLLVEPAAAAPLAALLTGAYRPEPGERLAIVLCGANLDPATALT